MGKGGKGKQRSTSRSSARKPRADADLPEEGSGGRSWRIAHGLAIGFVWFGLGVGALLAFFAVDLPSTDGL
ncbi:MAG: hypothetical protein K8S25_16810, partial [Alphaproteobacteria bacterium]|nr:hypothetical protein [Alphaproteobacteria bacterium]